MRGSEQRNRTALWRGLKRIDLPAGVQAGKLLTSRSDKAGPEPGVNDGENVVVRFVSSPCAESYRVDEVLAREPSSDVAHEPHVLFAPRNPRTADSLDCRVVV